jgi:hypothetical protein
MEAFRLGVFDMEKVNNGAINVRTAAKERGRANLLSDSAGAAPELERVVGNGTLGKVQAKRPDSGRFLVRVISVRKRLLDEDNLCEKYHVDCCRYSGLLPKDSPGTAKIEVSQQKAEAGGAEEVRIEIYRVG